MLNEDYNDMLHALSDEKVHIPSINDLIRNKRATGRTKDLADAETLEAIKNSEQQH
jgi:hypothetical protein